VILELVAALGGQHVSLRQLVVVVHEVRLIARAGFCLAAGDALRRARLDEGRPPEDQPAARGLAHRPRRQEEEHAP